MTNLYTTVKHYEFPTTTFWTGTENFLTDKKPLNLILTTLKYNVSSNIKTTYSKKKLQSKVGWAYLHSTTPMNVALYSLHNLGVWNGAQRGARIFQFTKKGKFMRALDDISDPGH